MSDKSSEKKDHYVPDIVSIASPIAFGVSFIADIAGIAQSLQMVWSTLMILSALLVLGSGIYTFLKRKKYIDLLESNRKLEKKLEKNDFVITSYKEKIRDLVKEKKEESAKRETLESLVCDGKQYLSNKATIQFDLVNKKYKLSFEKHYKIISDAIKWYEGQFYSNKYLDSALKSQTYYQDNPVSWDTLNITAELQYKNIEDDTFSNTKQLLVKQIAEGNNYKKFHIQYNTKNGGDKLPIKKGAEIILNYSYEVPVSLWGSYLNRYISYWREEAEVILCCKDKSKMIDDNIKIYMADHNTGEPYIIDIQNIQIDTQKGETSYSIKFPNNAIGKYSVWWNAEKIFGISGLNTDMTVDHSQQTKY